VPTISNLSSAFRHVAVACITRTSLCSSRYQRQRRLCSVC